MENKEIVVSNNSPVQMMKECLTGGATIEQIGKMLEFQERYEANQARKEYHKAMTAFKANPPIIEKDKKVAYGNTKYNHASLQNVTAKINEALSKHGLSASWNVANNNGLISVTCKITHERGHSEETTLSAPSDTSGAKNAIQAIGSAIAYLQRYSILSLCGLATSEMDNDAMGTGEVISEEEKNAILDNLLDLDIPESKFLEYMKVEKLENILKSDLKKAYSAFEQKRKK